MRYAKFSAVNHSKQKLMSASIITPVTLLTGFLGSGKTTLLNRFLKHPLLADTAVLINEFGAVSIDHLLVRESSENMVVLNNGCICCSVAGDMVTALRDLYFKRANNEIPFFKRVIIETTGLADPAPIMHTLIDMPLVAARYSLSGIVTTIDASHADAQLDTHFASVKQAAVADRIVITKADLVNRDVVNSLHDRLAQLNPGATVFELIAGEIDPAVLLDTGLYQAGSKTPDVAKWLAAETYQPVTRGHTLSAKSASSPPSSLPSSRHDDRIRSFVLTWEEPIIWSQLVDALEMLVTLRGDEILRVKGIINVANESAPRAIHAVQHTIYPVARLPAWSDADHRTRLVFITRDLSEDFVRNTFNNFIHPAILAA
jgi:G3E family GTPase